MLPAKINRQKELLLKALSSLAIYESLSAWQEGLPKDTHLESMKAEEIDNYTTAITTLTRELCQETPLKSVVELAENFITQ